MEKILIEVRSKTDSKLIHEMATRMGLKSRIIEKKTLEDRILKYLIDDGIKSGLATEDDYQSIIKKWK